MLERHETLVVYCSLRQGTGGPGISEALNLRHLILLLKELDVIELPEAAVLAKQLNEAVVGKKIKNCCRPYPA